MTGHLRLALLFVVVLACVAARATSALADPLRATHTTARVHPHVSKHVSKATRIAREQTKVARYARHLLGVPYSYGGTSPRSGFDCSGFTRFVYAHFGVTLPHYSVAQFDLGRHVSLRGLRPGDLLFFDGLGHVGLYIGKGRFIHAPHTGTRVSIATLSGWYASTYDGARRII